MAYVSIYYREPSRLGKHVRYIAERPGSTGLHGLGPEFRALRGTWLLRCGCWSSTRPRRARRQATSTRDVAFVRLLFTLPTDLARRVDRSAMLLGDGRASCCGTRSGRKLQGVYAIHFHGEKRETYGPVHVDLSPLDQQGRTTFPAAEQQARLWAAWDREVSQALARVERRGTPGRRQRASKTPQAPRLARRAMTGDEARHHPVAPRRTTRRWITSPMRRERVGCAVTLRRSTCPP